MSDIAKIKKLEEEQADRITEEREKAKERISRAEADASFRVGEAQKETREIISEILERGKEDASKEVLFIQNETTERNSIILNYNYGTTVWKYGSAGNSIIQSSYCCFQNNDFTMPSGTGNIAKDPLFVNPSGFNYHLKSQYGRWSNGEWIFDSVTSPCIDKGDPNDNFCREPLPNGGRINIGIYG